MKKILYESNLNFLSHVKLLARYYLECVGVLAGQRFTRAGVSAGLAAAALIIAVNVIFLAAYGGWCAGEVSDSAGPVIGTLRGAGYGLAGVACGLISVRQFLGALYQNPLFDRWGWPRKFAISAIGAFGVFMFLLGHMVLHDAAFARTCGYDAPSVWDAVNAVAGFAGGLGVYALRDAARAVPIEDLRITKDYAVMLDLARRAGPRASARRDRARLSLGVARGRISRTLLDGRLSLVAQVRVRAADGLGVLICAVSVLFCAIVGVAMGVDENAAGVAAATMTSGLVIGELLGAPELAYEDRVRHSGWRFRNCLAFFSAPFIGLSAVAWCAGAITFGASPASIAVGLCGAGALALRYVMRIAAFGAPAAALRRYLSIGLGAALSYQLLGPLGLVWMVGIPFYFHRRAASRLLGMVE